MRLLLAQQIEERRQQVHPPAVDLDSELEPEPIGLVAGVHVRVPRRIAVDDLVRVLGIDLHAEPQRAKLRDGVRGERAPRVDIAVELNQVVGLRVGRWRECFEARKLHRAEALENVPSAVFSLRDPEAPSRAMPPSDRKNCFRSSDARMLVPS